MDQQTQKSSSNFFASKGFIALVILVLLIVTAFLIAQNKLPHNFHSNAAVATSTPCQSHYIAGGSYQEGAISPCVNVIKTLVEGAHNYDMLHYGNFWTTAWTEPVAGPKFGAILTNDVNGFKLTTHKTSATLPCTSGVACPQVAILIPWTWPVKNLVANGIVNLNTYEDLCAQDVKIGVTGATKYCSLITQLPVPTTNTTPQATVAQPAATCTPRPIGCDGTKTSIACPQIEPIGGYCPLIPAGGGGSGPTVAVGGGGGGSDE